MRTALWRKRTALLAPLVAGCLLLGAATPVVGDVEVVRSGHCSGTATWRLEVEKDDGRIGFELKVNGTQAYKVWRVKIRQNGVLFHSRLRTANRYGNFEVERDRPDRYGTDTFTFRARQLSNDQLCTGTIRI